MKNKICLLMPYFGNLPQFLGLYLHSLEKQKNLDLILFTDFKNNKKIPNNIKFISMNLEEFNKLASKKLNLEINIKYPYKICDIKPAYGVIFSEYIKDYDFWAFGDIDLIYGDIFKLLPKNWNTYDLLIFREEWVSGSFAILKNNDFMNNLFLKSKMYKEVFTSQKHFCFDECYNLYAKLAQKDKTYILKYDTQESFTWLVRNEEQKGNLKVFSKKIIKESIGANDYVIYDNGVVKQKDGKEFIYYHYITEKRDPVFTYPKWEEIPNKFFIDKTGFYLPSEFNSWRYYFIKFKRVLIGKLKFFKNIFLKNLKKLKND
jgi:hypothetical protein